MLHNNSHKKIGNRKANLSLDDLSKSLNCRELAVLTLFRVCSQQTASRSSLFPSASCGAGRLVWSALYPLSLCGSDHFDLAAWNLFTQSRLGSSQLKLWPHWAEQVLSQSKGAVFWVARIWNHHLFSRRDHHSSVFCCHSECWTITNKGTMSVLGASPSNNNNLDTGTGYDSSLMRG